ncbi:carbohydrate ABC transporter permease [Paenibacillus aceris]|uniref:Raffinose/stachyose/melibiose transport system permease protein n=1 Tax=Paenibacillus aceris TaxID=869555 RepID=A0ABS4HXN8_9BACL|nr:carbohydrate ABC transporter permease [Paenibacillus aceris]MBP1963388.1 raffinose/stachyose/melibiose transport system permease protein [Paenibacillus aceris]NHW36105.1 carbohydrate ABC transporter permease [Paenibacillus aceris]
MKPVKKWMDIVTILICIAHILPFYVLLTTSLKKDSDLSSKWSPPHYLYLDNFKDAWTRAHLGSAFINDVVITGLTILVLILLGMISSYPLARYRTRWNRFMYTVFIAALIVPPLTILVPLYKFYVSLGALNTYWGMVLLHVTFYIPITIFLYTGFISSIPRELDEAALMDGSTRLGVIFKLILPLLKPVTATVIIVNGVNIWNDYQFSIFFLQKTSAQTFTVALSAFFGQYTNNVGWVAAGSVIAALPLAVLYLFLQKYFIHGLSAGAVKG